MNLIVTVFVTITICMITCYCFILYIYYFFSKHFTYNFYKFQNFAYAI